MWNRYADAARPVAAGRRVSGPIAATPALLVLALAVAGTVTVARASSGAGYAGTGFSGEAELHATVGQLVEEHLARTGVPGAAISIVADGHVLLSGGYGFADLEAGVPVDPDRSIFRIGSLSKLITATAAMQLVEEGRLRLDQDVNAYLDAFAVPPTYATPVTLARLMTHSAGFEEMATGTRARSLASMKTLRASLAERVPPRMHPPGEIAVYTNFALCLTGYLVERAAGMPFDSAVETRVLQPLGMTHTTSRQDLPERLAPHRTVGYEIAGGAAHARPFDIHEPVPAGGFGSTARDMALFMLAHLEDGGYGGARILEPASARAMRSPQFSNYPKTDASGLSRPGAAVGPVGAIGYGFWIRERNGVVLAGHPGRTRWFRAEMWLLPEQRSGVFVAFNGTAARPAEIVEALIEPLAGAGPAPMSTAAATASPPSAAAPSPAAPSPTAQSANATPPSGKTPPPAAEADPPLQQLAGDYQAARFGRHGPLRIINVLRGTRVALSADGSALRWRGETLQRRSPDVFAGDSGSTAIAFSTLPERDRRYMTTSRAPVYPYLPVPWYEDRALQPVMLVAAGAALLLSLVWWPLARRPGGRRRTAAAPAQIVVPALAAGLLSGAGVLVVSSTGIDLYYYGPSALLKTTFLFPYASGLLLVAAAIGLARFRRRLTGGTAVAQAVTSILSSAVLLWWLVHWNFAGWYW